MDHPRSTTRCTDAREVLDEIFGEENFVAVCIAGTRWTRPKNTAEFLSVDHDYVLVYAKRIEEFEVNFLPLMQTR